MMRLIFTDSCLGVRNSFKFLNTICLIVKRRNWDANYVLWAPKIMLFTSTYLVASLPVIDSFVARDPLGKE